MRARLPIYLVLALSILLAGSAAAYELHHAERIYPGVSVWGRDVGGVLPDRAAAELLNPFPLHEPLITLVGPDRSWDVSPSELGLHLESGSTLERAYRLGREDAWPGSFLSRLELLAFGADVAPVLTYDESQARHYVEALADEIEVAPVEAELTFDGTTPRIKLAREGRRLDVERTLAALSPVVTQLRRATVGLVVEDIAPVVRDAETARADAQRLLDGPLTFVVPESRENDPGPWIVDPEDLVEMLDLEVENGVLRVRLDMEPLRLYVESIAPALEIEPVDARFHFNEATRELVPLSASEEGRSLDVDASVSRISEALSAGGREVPLVAPAVPPRYPDTASAEELGIVDLVATGESYFIGSPSGRDHNIRLSAKAFDGLVIGPGETFSFLHHLGEVTEEVGYDLAFITAGEQLAMGVGGGICQVSTTVYRAAFWGGYPITERWAHSQRISYYELRGGAVGMDATIYSPHADLKFVNDRSAPLLMETEVQEQAHRLLVRIYSTDDGREVEMEGPEITGRTTPGPPIYQLDRDQAPGTVREWQSAVDGLTATIRRRVYDADGKTIYNETIVNRFAPRRAAYRYGPGYEPPE